jgi:hypothetical protein
MKKCSGLAVKGIRVMQVQTKIKSTGNFKMRRVVMTCEVMTEEKRIVYVL